MKCSECDGVGYKKLSPTSCAICERCGGMSEVKETNFDRITESPETLAEFIWTITDICLNYDKYSASEIKKYEKCLQSRNDVVEWLKEKYNERDLFIMQKAHEMRQGKTRNHWLRILCADDTRGMVLPTTNRRKSEVVKQTQQIYLWMWTKGTNAESPV